MYRDCLVSVCRVSGCFLFVRGFECAVKRPCVWGIKLRCMSWPRLRLHSFSPTSLNKHRKKAVQSLQKDRRHGLLVQGFYCAAKRPCALGIKFGLELGLKLRCMSWPRLRLQSLSHTSLSKHRKKSGQSLQKHRRHGLLVQGGSRGHGSLVQEANFRLGGLCAKKIKIKIGMTTLS